MDTVKKQIHASYFKDLWNKKLMSFLHGVGFLLLVFIILFPHHSNAIAKTKIINLGVIPHVDGGDEVERNMKMYFGQKKGIDQIIAPSSPEEFFNILLKYKKNGFQIKEMTIAGHGSADTPHIKFGDKTLLSENIDLSTIKRNIGRWERSATRNKGDSKKLKIINKKIETLKKEITFFDSISGVMTPGAKVKLINCSPLATKKGKKFVTDLGDILMGKNGGEITASTTDVNVDQVRTRGQQVNVRLRTGEWITLNDFVAIGDWKTINIPSKKKSIAKDCQKRRFHFDNSQQSVDFILLRPEELYKEAERFIKKRLTDKQKKNILDARKADALTMKKYYKKILPLQCYEAVLELKLLVTWDGNYLNKITGKKRVYKRGYQVAISEPRKKEVKKTGSWSDFGLGKALERKAKEIEEEWKRTHQ